MVDFVDFTLISFAEPSIGWVAKIVLWLTSISSIAAGIILFTIILKLITFPFDFYSKYSMRKNSVIMEGMRPELEKLQKQYANDKTLYNQKMMALYKKNGYSMWGACLPTILTLVIFIVAINGFTSFSQYQNKMYFYDMSLAYNTAIYDTIDEDIEEKYIVKDKDTGVITFTEELLKSGTTTIATKNKNNEDITISCSCEIDGSKKTYTISTGDKGRCILTVENNNYIYSFQCKDEETLNTIKETARERSAEKYREEQVGFLWVKNIWNTDSPLEHPVLSDWQVESSGCSSCLGGSTGFDQKQSYTNDLTDEQKSTQNMSAELYTELTYNLAEEKEQANGYFILCVLTAGISFLMQLVMSKSQKAQMELQTVDGQGARQQKMMMWMMPIMMAFFSFMYTSAFSIYLILSSVISILTTFLINWVVDKKIGKVEAKQEVIRSKYHSPEKKEAERKEKEEKRELRENSKGDFIPQEKKKKDKKGKPVSEEKEDLKDNFNNNKYVFKGDFIPQIQKDKKNKTK